MKKFFGIILVLLMSTFHGAFAQNTHTVKGRVIEAQTKSPIPFATVLLSYDEKPLEAIPADAQGLFTLKTNHSGKLVFSVSMVGYEPYSCEVEVREKLLDLGDISLSQGVALEEVVIAVNKPLVTSDSEKLSYSVEDDPQASGSTLDEIIRKVPQLSIDGEGNVLLNGQSNYKVLLNGHTSAAFNNNLKEMIQSMPADQIARIEVITNPSIKYDAEGVGGIINLVTVKKRQDFGYNGSVGTGFAFSENPTSYNENFNFSMQQGKLSLGMQGWFYSGEQEHTNLSWQENFLSENRYEKSAGLGAVKYRGGGFNFDMSYQPDTLNLLTFNIMYYSGKSELRSENQRTIHNEADEIIKRFDNRSLSDYSYPGITLGLNFEHNLGREKHSIILSDEFEYSHNPNTGYYDFSGAYNYIKDQYSEDNYKSNTLQIDYTNEFHKHHMIEAGAKHIFRHSSSPMNSLIYRNAQEQAEQGAYSDLDYTQHILALYVDYSLKYDKWTARFGGRMERTWNRATAEDQANPRYRFQNHQFNVIPYASLTFTPKPSHNLSLSYTQRLNRPSISMLSPAVDASSPLDISYGNPDLEAAVSHTFSLKYGHYAKKWSIMLGLSSYLSNNTMSSFTFLNDEGVKTTTYSNEVHTHTYGFNTALSYRPNQKFSLSLSVAGSYGKYDFDAMDIHTDHFSVNQNVNMDFALWKNARFIFGESFYSGHSRLGGHSDDMYYYYVGMKQQFFKKKLEMNLTMSNPFNRYMDYTFTNETPTYMSWQRKRSISRRFSFRLTYRFGKRGVQVKKTSRSIENTDIIQTDNKQQQESM